ELDPGVHLGARLREDRRRHEKSCERDEPSHQRTTRPLGGGTIDTWREKVAEPLARVTVALTVYVPGSVNRWRTVEVLVNANATVPSPNDQVRVSQGSMGMIVVNSTSSPAWQGLNTEGDTADTGKHPLTG